MVDTKETVNNLIVRAADVYATLFFHSQVLPSLRHFSLEAFFPFYCRFLRKTDGRREFGESTYPQRPRRLIFHAKPKLHLSDNWHPVSGLITSGSGRATARFIFDFGSLTRRYFAVLVLYLCVVGL